MNRGLSTLLGLFFAFACANPALCQNASYVGKVVFKGKPAPDVTVWLQGAAKDESKHVEARTDAEGRFRVSVPNESRGAYGLMARAADGRLGWRRLGRGAQGDGESDLVIELLPVGAARGRLTDSSGSPFAQAKIGVESFGITEAENGEHWHSMPSEAAKSFDAITKDDGTFEVSGVPLGAKIHAVVTSPRYAKVNIFWVQGQVGEFQLEKLGRLRIQLKGVDDPKKLTGLSMRLFVRSGPASGPMLMVNFSKEVNWADTATLVVDDVLPGSGGLRFYGSPESAYLVPALTEFAVKPGEVAEVQLTVEQAAHVRGRVVSEKARQPIAGAQISLRSQDPKSEMAYASAKTGEDGTFACYVRPGLVSAYLGQLPEGYVEPAGKSAPNEPALVAKGAEHVFPDFVLVPAVPLEGLVVNEAGAPVAGVLVHSAAWSPNFERENPRTDDKGRFVLKTLAAGDVTALRVRTSQAVTDGAVFIDTAETKGPIRLVLSEKLACRLKGRVQDGAGKPIAGASVSVITYISGVGRSKNWGTSLSIENVLTDAEGRFQTTALWPGDRYELRISAAGCSKSQAVVLRGEAGKTHDLPPIFLARTDVRISGLVADSAGKPIAGVAVFNNGDAPRPLSTTTDAAGRFSLNGLYDGPCYVFAAKPGYRFAMKRVAGPTSEATVTLLRDDEPVPAIASPVGAVRAAAERKAVDYLIDKVLAMPEEATGGYQHYVFGYLVRIDPGRAEKWLATNKPKAGADSPFVRAMVRANVKRAAADDAEDAVTLAAPLPSRSAIPLFFELAERFSKNDPARSLRFVEEAVVRARALDPADRAENLARAGDVVIRLGKQAAGKKLIDEAVLLGEKLENDERNGYYRARIAQYLVPHDLPRARGLVKGPMGETDNRYLSMLAIRVAVTDSKTALAIMEEMKADRSSYRALTQMGIARSVARRDPSEAVSILNGITDSSYNVHYVSEGLAHVAVVAAPRDRKLAWSLIDRSFAMYSDKSESFRSWSNYGGRSVFAAWTAGQAHRIGYPDMASAVARALACRPTDRDAHSPAHRLETLVRMAKVLALLDPAVARDMLEGVAPKSDLLGTGYGGFEHQDWLMARCLADPEKAPAFIDEALLQLAKQDGQRDFYRSGLMQLADAWTVPPDQRLSVVMGLNSGLALRGEEDW